jgi:hypothetical protein
VFVLDRPEDDRRCLKSVDRAETRRSLELSRTRDERVRKLGLPSIRIQFALR